MIDDIVEKYVQLRDKKAEFKAEYNQKVAQVDEALTRIEAHLQAKMQEQGLKSLPTSAGTAMLVHKSSATVAEWGSFLDYVKANNLWHMLKQDVNPTAIKEFRIANDDIPPGLNWREAVVVQVRRS